MIIIDGYKAVWSASVTMTFDDPFGRDFTLDATADYTITTMGDLPPFGAASLFVGSLFPINPSAPVVGDIIQSLLSKIESPVGYDITGLDQAISSILAAVPDISAFASSFPQNKYPMFYE
jgi:hypothetical protein